MNCRVAQEFVLDQCAHEGATVDQARAFAIGGCLRPTPARGRPCTWEARSTRSPAARAAPPSTACTSSPQPVGREPRAVLGMDKRTGIQLLPPHDRASRTYEEFWEQYQAYYEFIVGIQLKFGNIQHDLHRKYLPTLFGSATTPGCLDKGHDIEHRGFCTTPRSSAWNPPAR